MEKEEKKERKKKDRYSSLKKVVNRFESEMSKHAPNRTALTSIFDDLYNLATKDQLTGVFNRTSLDETLGREVMRAIRNKSPLSVIMIDIDNFKKYNDTYGHFQGDEALKAVTRIVTKNTREEDFVARYGGEEFIIVLPGADINKASQIAERIRKQIEEVKIKATSKDIPKGHDKITISLGISQLGKKGIKETLKQADQALYQAKAQGKNRIEIFKE